MSFGIVLLMVAVAAIIASIWMTSERDLKRFRQKQDSGPKPNRPRKEDIEDGTPPYFSALIDAIHYEGAANREEEKREDGGKAFRDYITLFILGLTFVALGITCWEIIQQVGEMQKAYPEIQRQAKAGLDAATAAHDQTAALLATNRPWVSAESVEILRDFGPPNARGEFSFAIGVKIKNTGPAVAKRGFMFVYPASGTGWANLRTGTVKTDFDDAWNMACDDARRSISNVDPSDPHKTGFTLAPNQFEIFRETTGNGLAPLLTYDNFKRNGFWLLGCILYKDAVSDFVHRTRFCFVPTIAKAEGEKPDFVACGAAEDAD